MGTIVDAPVVTDPMSGQSRDFGFVEMDEDSDADQAIDELSGPARWGRNINSFRHVSGREAAIVPSVAVVATVAGAAAAILADDVNASCQARPGAPHRENESNIEI